MVSRKHETVAHHNHEATNETRLEWTKPHVSPLGVADGTNGKTFSTSPENDLVINSGPS